MTLTPDFRHVSSLDAATDVTNPFRRVLILGGTAEAATLAARLVSSGKEVTTSLAGRTREPAPVAGQLRVGGFGGAEGLAAYLVGNRIDCLVDATHPFATTISANAKAAASASGVTLVVLERPSWDRREGDIWIDVDGIEGAAAALPADATAFLALGKQHVAPFARRSDVRFILRAVDPFEPEGFADARVIAALPSITPSEEAALFTAHGITHLVCRNSGGTKAYAKIEAARALGLPVIMIGR